MNNQKKSRKKGEDKSAVVIVNSVQQLSCVSQDTEPPVSTTRLHCVKQTSEKKKVRRSGKVQVENPHQLSPYAVKFEDGSPGETARRGRCARGDAWRTCQEF